MTCAYCGKPAAGDFTIHRDGYGIGPEVPLCAACGGSRLPTLADIWSRIAEPGAATIRPEAVLKRRKVSR